MKHNFFTLSLITEGATEKLLQCVMLYDNDFTLIIDLYFYETFSNPNH